MFGAHLVGHTAYSPGHAGCGICDFAACALSTAVGLGAATLRASKDSKQTGLVSSCSCFLNHQSHCVVYIGSSILAWLFYCSTLHATRPRPHRCRRRRHRRCSSNRLSTRTRHEIYTKKYRLHDNNNKYIPTNDNNLFRAFSAIELEIIVEAGYSSPHRTYTPRSMQRAARHKNTLRTQSARN